MNRREFKAFAFSFSLHFIVFFLYIYFFDIPTQEKNPEIQKIALGNLDIKELQSYLPSANASSEAIHSQQDKSTQQTPAIQQMQEAQKTKNTQEIQQIQEAQKTQAVTQKQASQKATQPKPNPTTITQPKQSPSLPSFYHLMDQNLESELKELYGSDYEKLTQEDRDYLDENYRKIYEITQRNLKYPLHAGKLGLQGNNKVEFDLQPNGDITNLRISSSSGYELFDKNSLRTIEISYKDYPHPSKPLKIIFHIHYKIRP